MIKVTPLIQNIKQEVIKLKDLYEYANYLKKIVVETWIWTTIILKRCITDLLKITQF